MLESQKTHERLLNHIVLPRYQPQTRSPNFPAEELKLLERMVQSVESLSSFLPLNTLKMARSLAAVHLNLTPSTVTNEINNLQPGETFAMFVRMQNCAIIFHMLANAKANSEELVVVTFPGKLHPKEVYTNPSDLEVGFMNCGEMSNKS